MPRIAYSYILPISQFIIYVLLIWYGCLYRPTWQSQLDHWLNPRPPVADGWDATWIDGPPSLAEQVALGVNAPAVLAATLLLVPFDSLLPNGASKELAAHVLAAFSLLPLWYFVGRRLDRRTAVLARASLVVRILTVSLLAAGSLVALLITASLLIRFGELVAARLLILVWATASIWAASRRLRLWRISAAMP